MAACFSNPVSSLIPAGVDCTGAVNEDSNAVNCCIAAKSRASTHAQELVPAGTEINGAAQRHRQQTTDEVSSSHTSPVGGSARLAGHRVNCGRMRILWNFYGLRNHRHQAGDAVRHFTFAAVHRSPRKLTTEVTKRRPSAETVSPFTGLFTGGDGPRSAITRTAPECVSRETSVRRRSSVSRMAKMRVPSRDQCGRANARQRIRAALHQARRAKSVSRRPGNPIACG